MTILVWFRNGQSFRKKKEKENKSNFNRSTQKNDGSGLLLKYFLNIINDKMHTKTREKKRKT